MSDIETKLTPEQHDEVVKQAAREYMRIIECMYALYARMADDEAASNQLNETLGVMSSNIKDFTTQGIPLDVVVEGFLTGFLNETKPKSESESNR